MSLLSEIKDNRLNLLQMFLSDQEIVDLVSDDVGHPIPALDLKCTQIFPYGWIDNTVTDRKVFLCFTLAARPGQSVATKKTIMRVYSFMHKDLVAMSDCIRQDAIFTRVEQLLNGNENLGISDVEFTVYDDLKGLPKDYYGAYAEYYVKNLNKGFCR